MVEAITEKIGIKWMDEYYLLAEKRGLDNALIEIYNKYVVNGK